MLNLRRSSDKRVYKYMEQGEIILYQPDEIIKLEVHLKNETVWLSIEEMSQLFGRDISVIGKHIRNIFKEEELVKDSVWAKFAYTAADGKTYQVDYYNLDVIISVGYRVKSKQGTRFRQWANQVLKEYMLKGHAINSYPHRRIEEKLSEHDRQIRDLADKVEFFVRTSLPPVEGVFFNGQIFDAYKFAIDLIKSAQQSIVLIDNYVDETVLLMLSKRRTDVTATIYTQRIMPQMQLDLEKHNSQYPPVEVKTYRDCHDRFLLIDSQEVYHIGASMKDLGKKMFAFSRLSIPATVILNLLDADEPKEEVLNKEE